MGVPLFVIEEIDKLGWTYQSGEYLDSKSRLNVRCKKCGFEKSITYKYRKQGAQCIRCYYQELGKTTINRIQSLLPQGFILLPKDYHNRIPITEQPLDIQCPNGHSFQLLGSTIDTYHLRGNRINCPGCIEIDRLTSLRTHLGRVGLTLISEDKDNLITVSCEKGHKYSKHRNNKNKRCRVCSADESVKWNQESVSIAVEHEFPKLKLIKYDSTTKKVFLQCKVDDYQWDTVWYSFYHYKSGCPKCAGNITKSPEEFVKAISIDGYTPISIQGFRVADKVIMTCPEGHQFDTTYHRFVDAGSRCPTCFHQCTSSSKEIELANWCESWTKVSKNDRTLLTPYEVDIWLPEYRIAIEYNGLYFHSEKVKSKDYHYKKYIIAKEANIKLLQFWEDEFICKEQIVKSIIRSRCGLYEHRLYGRDCTLEGIEHKIAKKFLGDNHLQGSTNFTNAIGLLYQGELIMLLTYGLHHRDTSGSTKVVNRICSRLDTQVVGGMQRLLNRVPKPFVTWSDNRYSYGGSYAKMMVLDAELAPDYQYVKSGRRHSKQSLRKTDLDKNSGLSESQLRKNQGYIRIWDAGKIRWRSN